MYRIITAIITMLALAVPLKAAPVTGGEKAISEGQLPAAARRAQDSPGQDGDRAVQQDLQRNLHQRRED